MTMDFDPNDQPVPVIPKWATFVPGRYPNFKMHKQPTHAKSAISTHGKGVLYEHVDGKWVERANTDSPDQDVCGVCGESTWREYKGWGDQTYRNNRAQIAFKKGTLELTRVCSYSCKDKVQEG